MRSFLLWTALLLGCASTATPPAPRAGNDVHFFAVLRLPPTDGPLKGKVFRGVLLEADGGGTWVASYTRDELWHAFQDRRVEVSGERYVPEDQALVAPHVRVKSMSLEHSDETAEFTRIGEEVTLEGKLEEWAWPAGSKLEGEKTIRFMTTENREFFLASKRPDPALVGQPVTVRARIVEPSPYNARPSGEHLWIYEIKPLSPH